MRTKVLLTDGWRYGVTEAPKGNELPLLPEIMESVCVPHVWNVENPGQVGCRVYQRHLRAEEIAGERVFLEFCAVAGVCRVWLNGQYIGEHRGGYSCFRFELTEALNGGDNLLTVTADNYKYQDICPLGGDFNNYGGIYREVSLISTGKNHFDLLYYGSSGLEIETRADGLVKANVHVVGEGKIIYRLLDGETTAAQAEATPEESAVQLQLDNPHLWNGKDDPYLYTLRAELVVNGVSEDCVSLRCGFRDCRVDADKGFFLNGEHLKLNGVAKHQDWDRMGSAPTRGQLDTDMELIREVGANALRLSHYQHPDYFYDLCDENGLLVWAEIPMLGMPDGNEAIVENAKQQMTEMILQNKHHPSIFCWGIQNEIAMLGESLEMYRKTEEINAHTKALDPSRPTTAANLFSVPFNSELCFIPDILGYNVYFGWYHHEMEDYDSFLDSFHSQNPQVPLCVSEYGVDGSPDLHSAAPKRKDYSEEFQALFHETVYPKLRDRDFVWGSFVWNMFDFGSFARNEGGCQGQNRKGLATFDRKIKKDAFYYYKANWSRDAFVHIGGRRFARRCGEETCVKVYSNQKSVQLFADGTDLGTLSGCAPVFTFEHVPLHLGENRLKAVSGSCIDEITLIGVTEAEPSYIYVDPNPEYNVKNWFTQEESSDKLFDPDCWSVLDPMRELLADPRVLAMLEKEVPVLAADFEFAKSAPVSLLKIFNLRRKEFTEDFVKEINRKLGTIKKPK